MNKDISGILKEYERIMACELELNNTIPKQAKDFIVKFAPEIYKIVCQIVEVAKSSTLPRSYIEIYGLNVNQIAYESVGAHTNLVSVLVDRALSYRYGVDFGEADSQHPYTEDGYSYREVMEVVRIHDLPENEIGDLPDNGSCDNSFKAVSEREYLRRFGINYPKPESRLKNKVSHLFNSMNDCSSPTGKILRLADKAAAIIMALCYDSIGEPPTIRANKLDLSERDRKEVAICDFNVGNRCKASEMWTIDFFCMRKFNEFDDNGFFIAIIVMYTLIVNDKWYNWREKDYANI